jgi:trk system potassium uptake protein
MLQPHATKFSPGRILLFSFLFVITIGSILLSLPISRTTDISLLNIIFTTTSTTCVTGLKVVPMSAFTFFGKCIILCLIQIGGLGLMTLSFFLISLFLNLGMSTKIVAGQLLEYGFWSKTKNFLFLIIGTTFIVELAGAIFLYFPFKEHMSKVDAIFSAFFHSVSAFCNAGITLFDNGLEPYKTSLLPLGILAFLVFAGSLGFLVWNEFLIKIKTFLRSLKTKQKHINFSLHFKIVMVTSLILVFVGAIITWLIEYQHSLKGVGIIKSIFISLFNSMSLRSAGFQMINMQHASTATLLIFLVLMFIGASPSSTGSGIKTTTFALSIATIGAIIKNRTSVEIFGRTVPYDQIYKAITIISLSIIWIFSLTFILLLTENDLGFFKIFFEAISAFSTCGYATETTPHLSTIGKILIMITMIIGRVGSLTLILGLRKRKQKLLYSYPKERIAIS